MVKNIALLGLVAALTSVAAAPTHENRGWSKSWSYHRGPKNCNAVAQTVTVTAEALPTQNLAAQPSAESPSAEAPSAPSAETSSAEQATATAQETAASPAPTNEPAAPAVSSDSATLASSLAPAPSSAPSNQNPDDIFKADESIRIGAASTPEDVSGNSAASKALLDRHNTLRALFGAHSVKWNAQLAQEAATHTGKCDNEHEGSDNLYWRWIYTPKKAYTAGGVTFPADDAACAWAEEWNIYKDRAPGFSLETGHFTTLVWKNVTEIGCGWNLGCNDKEGRSGIDENNGVKDANGENPMVVSTIYVSCKYNGNPNFGPDADYPKNVGRLGDKAV